MQGKRFINSYCGMCYYEIVGVINWSCMQLK